MTSAAANGRAAAAFEALPPQDLVAEEYVLGAMMISAAAIDVVAETLDSRPGGDFYRDQHATICRAILSIRDSGSAVDELTLCDHLDRTGELERVGGRERILEISHVTPAAGNVRHHAEIVRNHALSRLVITSGLAVQQLGWDATIDPQEKVERAQELAYALTQRRELGGTAPLESPLKAVFDRMTEAFETGQDMVGVSSGFRDLDRTTGGLEPASLCVLAARPGMGKSSLGLAIAANVSVRVGLPVAIFSLEMSNQVVAQRLLAREANVDLKKIRAPGRGVTQEEWSRIARAANTLSTALIYTNDRDNTLSGLRREIRRLKSREPKLALVLVDYLQLLEQRAENRTQEVTKITAGLKRLAVDYEVTLLAFSQLSRAVESRPDKRPQLSDMRDSGSIEQDADVVLLLYREGYYNENAENPHLAEINVAKHRNGATGKVPLHWDDRHATFREITYAH